MLTREQRKQFSDECPSSHVLRNGEPYPYSSWASHERLAYLDAWASVMLGTPEPETGFGRFAKLGRDEARAYKLANEAQS